MRHTFGDRMADKVASFGGSWRFIIFFCIFIILWILDNIYLHGHDKYPFILLNLILSCLAALQAPCFLMSQNRAAEIERLKAQESFQAIQNNQLEISLLHAKMDAVMAELEIRKSNGN